MFLLILLFTSGLFSEKSKDLKTIHYSFHILSAQFVLKHLEEHTYTTHTHMHTQAHTHTLLFQVLYSLFYVAIKEKS